MAKAKKQTNGRKRDRALAAKKTGNRIGLGLC
jgi:hypothetical protein